MKLKVSDMSEIDEIVSLCQLAFRGSPWFENMDTTKMRQRLISAQSYDNFMCCTAEIHQDVVSVCWLHEIKHHEIVREKALIWKSLL